MLFLLGAGYACVEPYDIQSRQFDRTLVVDARFTDEAKPHYVKLSYTRPLGTFETDAVSGAQVWVESTEGERIDFNETDKGIYLTDSAVAGIPGNTYQLHVIIDDQEYQSTPELLMHAPPIDSVYPVYGEKIVNNELWGGIQFALDTHDETGTAKYFKYEWEETYEVRSSYPSLYEYLWDKDSAVIRDAAISVCYASGQSSAIILGTTANQATNRLAKQELRFITPASDHLKYAYSILARQYTISGAAYAFFREIVENNDQGGSLFGKQLGAVVGNMTAVSDPDQTIAGYFEVAGVSEKRIFVEYEDLDSRFGWPQDSYACSGVLKSVSQIDSLIHYVRANGYGIITASYCDTTGVTSCPFYFQASIAPAYCTDCRFRGPIEKPDFWIL